MRITVRKFRKTNIKEWWYRDGTEGKDAFAYDWLPHESGCRDYMDGQRSLPEERLVLTLH